MPRCFSFTVAIAVLVSSLSAADKMATQILPPSIAAYVEIPKPPLLIDGVLDHPLAEQIEKHPNYQKYYASPEYQKYQEAVRLVEDKLGMRLRPALTALSAEGIHIGGDIAVQGIVVLVRSSDATLTTKARDAILELVRAEASSKGNPDPVKSEEYRGVTLHQLDRVQLAAHDRWLVASNKPLLMRAILSNCLDDDTPNLATEPQFETVYKERPANATAWAYVDLRLVKAIGALKTALAGKSDNPGAELLIGGILGALPDAPYVTGTLKFDPSQLNLTLTIPASSKNAAKHREFYFGKDGAGQAPPLLEPKQAVLSVSTYRDFASLWRHAPDLFNEEVNAKFAEAETGLSTFFSGRNFRDDILGNLEPGLQLVVARQDYAGAKVTPALKLPGGAIVVKMKKPEETAQIFKITFQSAIGFLNVVGGMNGLDPLDVNSEKQEDMLVVASEYLAPKDVAAHKSAAPHYNATPTAVFVGDRFILSSSKSLALELAELVRKQPAGEKDVNTAFKSDVQVLREILSDNQDSLIAQNMLEKGHDRTAAEKEVGGLLTALGLVKDTSLKLNAGEKRMSVSWEVRLK